jgi:hypothetical protein
VNGLYKAVVKESLLIDRAAGKHPVPARALRDRGKGTVDIDIIRSGPKSVFLQEQEAILVRHLTVIGEVGVGYFRQETINPVSDYAFRLSVIDKVHPVG